ncbi:MAG: polyisoprenoid-binding protein [Geminicoccaceae bacterium]|nr:polyisoprenoid-binding protein [Geminicoccaceae bacterium]MCB9942257.1 polyisoprenoid-binding protein [Geminicoccaceae bacterium]
MTFRTGRKALLLALPVAMAGMSALAEPRRYTIDPEHFSIVFSVEHIGYQHQTGLFLDGGGHFTYDEDSGELADLVVDIDAASVFTDHDARDNHVRSKDFLDAKAHPGIRFVMTSADAIDDRHGTIHGDLTLRGVTLPVDVDVTLNRIGPYPWGENYVIGISAGAHLKRSDFGSTYGVEGNLVGDDVQLRFEIEAIRQP